MEDTVPEDGSGLFGNETDDLEHTRQRHSKCLVADFHQDGPKNGERQRKTDEEAGSAPGTVSSSMTPLRFAME